MELLRQSADLKRIPKTGFCIRAKQHQTVFARMQKNSHSAGWKTKTPFLSWHICHGSAKLNACKGG